MWRDLARLRCWLNSMGVELVLQRHGDKLLPASEADAEMLKAAVSEGSHVRARLWIPRNLPFHRWFWALLDIVSSNHEIYDNPQKLHIFLKLNTGEVELFKIGSETIMVPKSTSFARMDQTSFKVYVDRALKVIDDQLWHNSGVRRQTLINEVNKRSSLNYKELTNGG